MCKYPTFGKKCSQQCEYEKQLCNFELGCPGSKYCLITVKFMHLWIFNDDQEKHKYELSTVTAEL